MPSSSKQSKMYSAEKALISKYVEEKNTRITAIKQEIAMSDVSLLAMFLKEFFPYVIKFSITENDELYQPYGEKPFEISFYGENDVYIGGYKNHDDSTFSPDDNNLALLYQETDMFLKELVNNDISGMTYFTKTPISVDMFIYRWDPKSARNQ